MVVRALGVGKAAVRFLPGPKNKSFCMLKVGIMSKKDIKRIVNFIYETGNLQKTPRSGLWFLGTGKQSVAEHTLRTALIGWAISALVPKVNQEKVALMCLFHDLGEGRTSDLNYVHQRYGRLAESEAIGDIARSVPFGKKIEALYLEFEKRKTIEAKLAKDADQLEWISTLREEQAKGNVKAKLWAKYAYKRLKTSAGRKIGKLLLEINPDSWWLDVKDKWFIDRKEKYRKWRK